MDKKIKILFPLLIVVWLIMGISTHIEAAFWDLLNPAEIPVFPALHKVNEQNHLINGVRMKMVLFEGEGISIPQVVDYYKTTLAQRGWLTKGEKIMPDGSVVLNFTTKDQRTLSLTLVPGNKLGKPNYVFVRVAYSLEGLDKWIVKSPSDFNKDMPGQDIPWLKRYPESIRIQSVASDQGFISANYRIDNYSCTECVADFYKQEMAQKGWKLVNSRQHTKDDYLTSEGMAEQFNEMFKRATEAAQAQSNSQIYLPSKDKEGIKRSLESLMPDSLKALYFQKDDNICLISIAYTKPKTEEDINLMSQVSKQGKGLDKIIAQQLLKEKVEIAITYIPKSGARKERKQ